VNINNENNLSNKKIVYDLTPFSHLDYPNQLSCIVWFTGCNMRCDYCYNTDIVFSKKGTHCLTDIIEFLETRVGLLDAVVLSGGEATSHYIKKFCIKIKKLGFKIKLDTNGVNFTTINELVDLNLLDYIALDYKAPSYKFRKTTHNNQFYLFEKTLNYLLKKKCNFEVRTTVHNDLLDESDVNFIIYDLVQKGYKGTYFIQEFLYTKNTIKNLMSPKRLFNKSLLTKKLNIVYR